MIGTHEQTVVALILSLVSPSVHSGRLYVDVRLFVFIKKIIKFMMSALHSIKLLLHLAMIGIYLI